VIHGQRSKLTRTGHGIAYSPARDEIFSSEATAGAIIAFNGGADGETAPLRVIQGPRTALHQPWALAVDDPHQELIAADYGNSQVLTYAIDANGDVAPKRVIGGAKTGMRGVLGLAVDPERSLVVVAARAIRSRSEGAGLYSAAFKAERFGGLFIFNRADNGDIPPRAAISGLHTGIEQPGQLAVYDGQIFAAVGNINYMPAYDRGGFAPRKGCTGPPPDPLANGGDHSFIGVWKTTDHGDAPPREIIFGPATGFTLPGGIAVDGTDGEIYITDSVHNGTFAFLVPQFFRQ
jgi:hypothetical protein